MFRRALGAAGALLGAFHVWLFVVQAWTGELFARPGSLSRWLVGAGLVAALIGLHRRGIPIVFGRKALAIWLVALLLHGPAMAGALQSAGPRASSESTEVFVLVLAAAAGLGLLLALGAARSRRPAVRVAAASALGASHVTASAAILRRLLAPRPPPLRWAPRFSL